MPFTRATFAAIKAKAGAVLVQHRNAPSEAALKGPLEYREMTAHRHRGTGRTVNLIEAERSRFTSSHASWLRWTQLRRMPRSLRGEAVGT